jgi:hypothetical protein
MLVSVHCIVVHFVERRIPIPSCMTANSDACRTPDPVLVFDSCIDAHYVLSAHAATRVRLDADLAYRRQLDETQDTRGESRLQGSIPTLAQRDLLLMTDNGFVQVKSRAVMRMVA